MHRSSEVRIAFMGAFALIAMQGCGDSTYQHCVDENGIVVADSSCESSVSASRPTTSGPAHYYRWWYGGHVMQGSQISGGSYTAPARSGSSVARASSVTRGVFGRPGGLSHHSGGGHGASS